MGVSTISWCLQLNVVNGVTMSFNRLVLVKSDGRQSDMGWLVCAGLSHQQV